MPSPPGTSPTPVRPALSFSTTRLRVKKGPWAPHRFSSMLSWPATGMTCMSTTVGVSALAAPCACSAILSTSLSRALRTPPSTHQGGALAVEGPARDQVLHRRRVIARAERLGLVECVRLLDLRHVQLHAEAGPVGDGHLAAGDARRLLRQPLAVLPDPVRVDGGDPARRGRRDVGEH